MEARKKRQDKLRRTLRRSRRQAAQKKRKECVGEVMGLTPKKAESTNMKEAIAEQLAEVVAERHDRQSDVHRRVNELRRTDKTETGHKSKTNTLRNI